MGVHAQIKGSCACSENIVIVCELTVLISISESYFIEALKKDFAEKEKSINL